MPSILNELEEASFKGAGFLISSASTTGGRKTATHEFVNSDQRTVEDLGKLQKVFSIEAIINNQNGEYFARKNALIDALENPGKGVLKHPFYGVLDVVAKPYTIVERISDLGAAFFDLTFERAEERISILPTPYTLSNISQKLGACLDSLGVDIENNFSVNRAFPFNFISATNKLTAIGDKIESVTSTFDRVQSEINAFQSTLNEFRNNIRSLIQAPGQLKTALLSLYDTAVSLTEIPQEAVLTLEKLFAFGDDDPEILQTTAERVEKAVNQDLLNIFMQAGALSYAYERAVNIDFFTITEINTYANKLNTQYNKVFPLITETETSQALQDLRDITNEFLDIQRLNVKKIVAFETNVKPVNVLAYQLYGSISDSERLANLNMVKDLGFIEGNIEVFR